MGCQSKDSLTSGVLAGSARWVGRCLYLVAFAAWPGTSSAQDIFKALRDLAGTAASAIAPSKSSANQSSIAPASPASSASSASETAMASLEPLRPSSAALHELVPDAQCLQVVENFDVLKKAQDYAGTAATLRLQTLVASDFAQSDLSQSDQDLLRYLAYTTVWVPVSIEDAAGRAWSAFTTKGSDAPEPSGRSQRKALERQADRLEKIRISIDGFPRDANLQLDLALQDGAFSRVGGIVVLSPRFLSMMDQRDGARDVLLAHELAHLYKRHSLKALQYQLIGSIKGWNIAKRLLRQSMSSTPTGSANPVAGAIAAAKMAIENIGIGKDVIDFIKENQTRYSVDQEFEADACAMRWLDKMAIAPGDAWRAFAEVLQDPGPSADASYVSVHPSPRERSENIALFLGRPLNLPPTAAGTASAPAIADMRRKPSAEQLPSAKH